MPVYKPQTHADIRRHFAGQQRPSKNVHAFQTYLINLHNFLRMSRRGKSEVAGGESAEKRITKNDLGIVGGRLVLRFVIAVTYNY